MIAATKAVCARSVSDQTIWSAFSLAFTAYWSLFATGAMLGRQELNSVGGVIVLAVMLWACLERLWVHLDGVVMASLAAAMLLPLLQIALIDEPPSPQALFKHISVCMVMACSRMLALRLPYESKSRFILSVQILVILLISCTIHKGTSWDGGTRHSGLFLNPNNLALIPFLLLFFVHPVRDKWFIRLGAHGVVALILAFSGTSGAVLAYVIALAFHLRKSIPSQYLSGLYVLLPCLGLAAVFLSIGNRPSLLPQTRITKQVEIIGGQMEALLNG